MVRYVVFLLASYFLIENLPEQLGIPLADWPVFAGILIAALAGAANFAWEWFFGTIRHPFRPQVVVLPTRESPWQVMRGCFSSLVRGVLILLVLIYAYLSIFHPEIDILGTIEANINEIAQGFGVTVE